MTTYNPNQKPNPNPDPKMNPGKPKGDPAAKKVQKQMPGPGHEDVDDEAERAGKPRISEDDPEIRHAGK